MRPFAEEVVRTAQVWFTLPEGQLDLERVSAFTAGYRAVVALEGEALLDAEARLWWKRASEFLAAAVALRQGRPWTVRGSGCRALGGHEGSWL